MKKKTKKIILKSLLIGTIIAVLTAVTIGLIIFFTPHRDVKNTPADYNVVSTLLVDEYLTDSDTANEKYLSEDGDSKIFEVTGRVDQVFKNQKGQDVILLKPESSELGVQCTFILGESIQGAEIGNTIAVKGKIEKGASFDTELEIGEDVLVGECSIVQ